MSWRDRVVPAEPHTGRAARPARCRNIPDEETAPRRPGAERGDTASPPDHRAAEQIRRLRRYAWVDLLRRVFAVDVLECPDCGGRMRVIAFILDPAVIRKILQHRPRPEARAHAPPGG